MSDNFKKALLGFLIMCLIALAISTIYQKDRISKVTPETKAKIILDIIRKNIKTFYQNQGRYPNDLSELKRYIADDPNQNYIEFSSWKEYISSNEGNDSEHSVLNGKGGWYYNNQSGEVSVNLTNP